MTQSGFLHILLHISRGREVGNLIVILGTWVGFEGFVIPRCFQAMTGMVIAAMEKLENEGPGIINHNLNCFFKSVAIFV